MANVITDYLQKNSDNPNKRVTNAMLLNTIRQMADSDYQAEIPEIDPQTRINHISIPYESFVAKQNEFFNVLINKIGVTMIKALLFENPLGVFRTENFEYGETVEEIYVGLTDALPFDAKSTVSPFQFADTDIKVFYHDLTDERQYPRTIERAWTVKAFKSEKAFDDFIDKMFMSLLSSDELDEYTAIKNLIPLSLTPVPVTGGGTIETPSTEIDTTAVDWLIDFNEMLMYRSNLMSVPSRTRFENGAQVPQATKKEDQYLIVDAITAAKLDNLYANAFNMDKITPLIKKIVVDDFPQYTGTGPLNGAQPIAALVSSDTIILKDKLLSMENIYNPRTMSFNYFLNHHQLISYSLIGNAHIFYTL